MRRFVVLFFILAGFFAYADECSWLYVNNHYHFMKEIYFTEYDGNKCIHINYNDDWNKNNYSIMFFTRGRETGTMYYEGTDKSLDYVLDLISVYVSKNLSFYEIIQAEFGEESEIEVSNLTGMKMSMAFGNSIFVYDKKQ